MGLTPSSKAKNRTLEASIRFAPHFLQESLMHHKNTLTSHLGFSLMQVDTLPDSKGVIRSSYEVVDSSEEVIGRFGSLKEAQSYINLVSELD